MRIPFSACGSIPSLLLTLTFCLGVSGDMSGQQISVALDLYYSDPADTNSAGSWELVAIASDRGLAGLNVELNSVDLPMFMAPTGSAASVPTAGFHENFGPIPFATSTANGWSLLFGQVPVDSPGPQGIFYDVGVPGAATQPGENGTPNIAGLSGSSLPWNYDDTLGDFITDTDSSNNNGTFHDGVLLAMGTFAANASVAFGNTAAPGGNVFTQVGDSMSPPPTGSILQASVVTFVRDNTSVLAGDANLDGVVDVSDFNIWNANKFTTNGGWRNGDFNGDKNIDVSDFNIWNSRKFTSVDTSSVPEPSGLPLAFLAAITMVNQRRRVKKIWASVI